jgi:hypothetical protein
MYYLFYIINTSVMLIIFGLSLSLSLDRSISRIMFSEIVVLYEIYIKNSFCPNTFDQRLCVQINFFTIEYIKSFCQKYNQNILFTPGGA